MIGVWMTPCENGQCELSVRRDGINKIVIASQTQLTDEQAEELFWCIEAMQRSGKTLKDLLKEQKAKEKERKPVKVVYTDYGVACGSCGYLLQGGDQSFCPKCGAEVDW